MNRDTTIFLDRSIQILDEWAHPNPYAMVQWEEGSEMFRARVVPAKGRKNHEKVERIGPAGWEEADPSEYTKEAHKRLRQCRFDLHEYIMENKYEPIPQ